MFSKKFVISTEAEKTNFKFNQVKIAYVYILGSSSGKLYVGITNNLERRIGEHKEGINDGYAKKTTAIGYYILSGFMAF